MVRWWTGAVNRKTKRWWTSLAGITCILVATAAPAEVSPGRGTWWVVEGYVAPWADHAVKPYPDWPGREVRFATGRLLGPHPLACDEARHAWWFVEAEGLFEGNLPVPATDAADELGLRPGPVPTLRVTCPNAGFDFHLTSDGDLLIGLDNVIWRLRPVVVHPTPSVPADPTRTDDPLAEAHSTPAGPTPLAVKSAVRPLEPDPVPVEPFSAATAAVEALLLHHFTHDMAFTADSISLKRVYLSPSFATAITAWLALPASPDEAPLINGDPFTDTQEYPDHFSIGIAQETPAGVVVPVVFGDDSGRRVDYMMVLVEDQWVVDDLVDGRGESLRGLLAAETNTSDEATSGAEAKNGAEAENGAEAGDTHSDKADHLHIP